MNDFSRSTLLGKSVHRMGLSSGYGLDEAGVRVALDLGVNYFWYTRSTMPAMTAPLKERVKTDRESLFIASGPTLGYTAGQVRRGCEDALKKLGTDHLDLLQVFWVGKTSRLSDSVLGELNRLKEEGKCRGIGVSIHDRERAGKLAADKTLDVLMLRYNAAHPGAEDDIFPHIGEGADKVGVVTYTSTRWGTLIKAEGDDITRPATAAECYRFALSHPAVDVVLTAPGSTAELQENFKAMEQGPLDPQGVTFIRDLGKKIRASSPMRAGMFEGF